MHKTAQIKFLGIFNRVGYVDLLMFTKHLGIMLKSGVSLVEGLEILESQTRNKVFREVLAGVTGEVKNGQPLYKSLEKYPDVFDTLFVNVVQIGENSGVLEENLEYLASQMGKTYGFRKKVKTAMMYPSFVIVTALIIGSGISLFVLPKLVDLFSSIDVELPITTKLLLFVAITMKNYGFVIVPSIFLGIIGFSVIVNLPKVKPLWHGFLLKLPYLGNFIQFSQVSAWGRNLGLMLKSGLSISVSMNACAKAAGNEVFRSYITRLAEAVEKGKALNKELLTGDYRYMPTIVQRMISVGEKTGKLDETLIYLADFYEDEVDDMTKNLSSVLEPILLVAVALMVGFLAIAIISPVYQFTSSMQR